MTPQAPLVRQASCVALGGRGILIEGAAGSGKSSLALALIDRGAVLVGDDGVLLAARDAKIWAEPHPRTSGLLEVRNLGLLHFAAAAQVTLALVVQLDPAAPRFIDAPEAMSLCGLEVPGVRLWPDTPMLALRAELALERYGLT